MAKEKKEYKDDTRNCGVKIQKNKREQIHTYFNTYKDEHYFNIRVFYEAEDGTYLPSAKGISIAEEDLPKLLEAIKKSTTKRKEKNDNRK